MMGERERRKEEEEGDQRKESTTITFPFTISLPFSYLHHLSSLFRWKCHLAPHDYELDREKELTDTEDYYREKEGDEQ